MSRTLTISDALYDKLEAEARGRGLNSIEKLLEKAYSREEDLRRRQEAVHQADALRQRITANVGIMPDSTDLVREDRQR